MSAGYNDHNTPDMRLSADIRARHVEQATWDAGNLRAGKDNMVRWCRCSPSQDWPCDTARETARADKAEAALAAEREQAPWVCAYCGAEAPGGMDYTAADLTAHAEECEQHPLRAARALADELRTYARHKRDCATLMPTDSGCTCGLDLALAKWEASRAE